MKKLKKVFAVFTALLIVGIAGVLVHFMQAGSQQLPVRQYFPAGRAVAVWDWQDPATRSPNDLKQLDQFFYLHQINTIYVDISSYADIDPARQPDQVRHLEDSLARYVDATKDHNIQVFAAAGNTDWSKPENRHIPLSIQNFVNTYNEQHRDAQLAGLEFDIEAYNQQGFPESSTTEKALTLTEYLNTVQAIVTNQRQHNNVEVGFAIPYWFDNENGNIPAITWNGKTGPTLYHLVDTLNALPKANIVVMAYRNAATGNDGSIFHSRTEVDYAQAKAPNVKVLIGQEDNDAQPAKITFYGTSITELSREVGIINDTFKDNNSYGGIAINDLAGLERLDSTDSGKLF